MTFTHYFNHCNGCTTLLNLTTCENCGTIIQAPNSVGGVEEDIPKYLKLGMKPIAELPPEGYYSDELEGEACYSCNG